MEPTTTLIQCKRVFPHPAEHVYAAFLDPGQVRQWFGPREFSIGTVEIDAVPGGQLAIEMIPPNGDRLWVKGAYTALVHGVVIAYTFAYEPDLPGLGSTLVTINFNRVENGTEVTLVHTIYKTINPTGRAKGWEAGLDKMETLLNTKD
jgi:uncharacterized protein YndB with AHSA1/START domain